MGDFHRDKPRPLTVSEIEDIVDKFGSAAERAQKAGFDGVNINAASSHLLHNFLSPFWNRREDDLRREQSRTGRRFPCEVIREIKRRTSPDFAWT